MNLLGEEVDNCVQVTITVQLPHVIADWKLWFKIVTNATFKNLSDLQHILREIQIVTVFLQIKVSPFSDILHILNLLCPEQEV